MKRQIPTVLALLVLAGVPAAADFSETATFNADELTVRNLVGEVTVRGHSGSAFEVRVDVQGRDANEGRVRVDKREDGAAELRVVFPLGESTNYVYPRLGEGSRTTLSTSDRKRSWLGELLSGLSGKNRITVSGSGRGLEIWADIEVLVPRGSGLQVLHGVGRIDAGDVQADLLLDNSSGTVSVARVDGEVTVDTGSGRVGVEDVRGNLLVDTGSGRVELRRCDGDAISVDTGSGGVLLESIRGRSVSVDTGSGSVEASRIEADNVLIDTGSGSVTLELHRMGEGDFEIDTGSGRITLALPADASAEVRAETGSGGIDLDFDEGIRLRKSSRDEVAFTIGGGAANVRLDTGSGGIRIKRSD